MASTPDSNDRQPRAANQRGAARLAAVQALYQMDIGRQPLEETLAQFASIHREREVEGEQYLPADADFFRQIVTDLSEDEEAHLSQMTVLDVRTEDCWLLIGDIVGFTPLSQQTPADELAALVGRWVRTCKEHVEGNGGAINKFLGDGFMAYWLGRAETLQQVVAAMKGLRAAQEKSDIAFRVIVHFGKVALGGSEEDSTPAFDKLDGELVKAMDQGRITLRNDVINARSGLSGAQVGGVVLSLGAAIAVALGLWPRLKEYR